jgi:hypothetical protein
MDRFTECKRLVMYKYQCVRCALSAFCDDPRSDINRINREVNRWKREQEKKGVKF